MTTTEIWGCKIGEVGSVARGADYQMRQAVWDAYKAITGVEPVFIFSGWGASLTEPERAVVENRLPAPATAPAQPALERKPMTDEEVIDLVRECGLDWHKGFMPLFDDDPTNRFAVLVRAVEASHDIKDAP